MSALTRVWGLQLAVMTVLPLLLLLSVMQPALHMRTTLSDSLLCVCVSFSHRNNVELVNTFQTKPRGRDSVLWCSPHQSHYASTHNSRFSYTMRATTTTVTTAAGSIVTYSLWFYERTFIKSAANWIWLPEYIINHSPAIWPQKL